MVNIQNMGVQGLMCLCRLLYFIVFWQYMTVLLSMTIIVESISLYILYTVTKGSITSILQNYTEGLEAEPVISILGKDECFIHMLNLTIYT